jgi:shikimate dehydrogenase
VQALRGAGIDRLRNALVLGGGATAASVLVAVVSMGASHVEVAVRTPAKAEPLAVLGARLGAAVSIVPLGHHDGRADAVISTLPGAAEHGATFGSTTGVLLDVAYDPWPSELAAGWTGPVVPGLEMLLHQAVAQVRIFVGGSPEVELPDEATVVAAMRGSVGLTA